MTKQSRDRGACRQHAARLVALPRPLGWGARSDDGAQRVGGGRLCGPDCDVDPLLDLMNPLFRLDQPGEVARRAR